MNIRWSINKSNIINYILTVKVQQQLSDIVKRQQIEIDDLKSKVNK